MKNIKKINKKNKSVLSIILSLMIINNSFANGFYQENPNVEQNETVENLNVLMIQKNAIEAEILNIDNEIIYLNTKKDNIVQRFSPLTRYEQEYMNNKLEISDLNQEKIKIENQKALKEQDIKNWNTNLRTDENTITENDLFDLSIALQRYESAKWALVLNMDGKTYFSDKTQKYVDQGNKAPVTPEEAMKILGYNKEIETLNTNLGKAAVEKDLLISGKILNFNGYKIFNPRVSAFTHGFNNLEIIDTWPNKRPDQNIEQLKNEIDLLEKQIKEIEFKINVLKLKTDPFEIRIFDFQKEYNSVKKEINTLEIEKIELNKQLDKVSGKIKEIQMNKIISEYPTVTQKIK